MTVDERIKKHVCCFCEGKLEHYKGQDPDTWGNNPDNACSIPNARCCKRCDVLIVQPVRMGTWQIIKKVLGE